MGVAQTQNATLKCTKNDYEYYDSYIGALTADELVFAVAKPRTTEGYHYLKDNASAYWYNLSLADYDNTSDFAFRVSDGGGMASDVGIATLEHIRPSIILKPYTKIIEGDGLITSPYVVSD